MGGLRARVQPYIVAAAVVVPLILFAGVLRSILDLRASLEQAHSIYDVDIKGLSVEGELQYQIQESRRRFLQVLVEAGDAERQLAEIRQVREADLRVSLLTGEALVLKVNPATVREFAGKWDHYLIIRDDMIALALQDRIPEALEMEKARGVGAFERAAESLRGAKSGLDDSSARKVEVVWNALRRALLVASWMLGITFIFLGCVLAAEFRRRRTLSRLRIAENAARESKERLELAQRAARIGVWEWDPVAGRATCSPRQFGLPDNGNEKITLDAGQLRALVHPDDHDGVFGELADAAARGGEYETEFRVRWPDETEHWLAVKGQIVRDPATGSGQLLGASIDITTLKLAEETLRESEQRFRNAFHEAAVGMVILDPEGRFLSVNKGMTEITQYSAEELRGRPVVFLLDDEQKDESASALARVVRGEIASYRAERRCTRKDGVAIWMRSSVSMMKPGGGPGYIVALCEDITDQKQAREKLRHQALHDPLTGLPNRRHFEQSLNTAIEEATRGASEVALLFLDLDGFKLVNDTFGHPAGDLLLKHVALRVQSLVGGTDLLARVGGDEFTVVLSGLDGPEIPRRGAENLLEAFKEPFSIHGNEISIGASVGISRFPHDGRTTSALLQSADAAMYSAKYSGNNRYQFFTSRMKEDAHERLLIESCLRRALDLNEISVQFQPQYELASNRLVRFEALCRWNSEELGQVPPQKFIPIAEETGTIVPIGLHVLREACGRAVEWQSAQAQIQVAVNVSAVQFSRADFVDSVIEVLRETGLSARLLDLELTESSFVRDKDDSIRKMNALRRYGVRISIDDFGTGYSSLSYLQSMPVDALKVDRSFTAKIASSPTAVSMVRAVIAMARALGLRVVTEGVENADQVDILRHLGCDEVQGFLYGRPEGHQASMERVWREASSALPLAALGSAVAPAEWTRPNPSPVPSPVAIAP
jgi:diguanylate cyclase (GGDEF)-like protein/PAS domain S-box-containing protein